MLLQVLTWAIAGRWQANHGRVHMVLLGLLKYNFLCERVWKNDPFCGQDQLHDCGADTEHSSCPFLLHFVALQFSWHACLGLLRSVRLWENKGDYFVYVLCLVQQYNMYICRDWSRAAHHPWVRARLLASHSGTHTTMIRYSPTPYQKRGGCTADMSDAPCVCGGGVITLN